AFDVAGLDLHTEGTLPQLPACAVPREPIVRGGHTKNCHDRHTDSRNPVAQLAAAVCDQKREGPGQQGHKVAILHLDLPEEERKKMYCREWQEQRTRFSSIPLKPVATASTDQYGCAQAAQPGENNAGRATHEKWLWGADYQESFR